MTPITWTSPDPQWFDGKRDGNIVAIVFESLEKAGTWKWRQVPYKLPAIGPFSSADEAKRAAEEALS